MPFNKVSDTDVAVRVISTVVAVQVEHTVVLVLVIVTAYVQYYTRAVIVAVIGDVAQLIPCRALPDKKYSVS